MLKNIKDENKKKVETILKTGENGISKTYWVKKEAKIWKMKIGKM